MTDSQVGYPRGLRTDHALPARTTIGEPVISPCIPSEHAAAWARARPFDALAAFSSFAFGPVLSAAKRLPPSIFLGRYLELLADVEPHLCGNPFRTLERVLAGRARDEHRPGAVGAAAERREDVARVAVDADALPLRHLDAVEHPRRRHEKARHGAADQRLVSSQLELVPERCVQREPVQVHADRCFG